MNYPASTLRTYDATNLSDPSDSSDSSDFAPLMPSPLDKSQLTRWRLILGQHAQESLAQMGGGCELSAEQTGMDEALAAIYDETSGGEPQRGQRSAGLGPSAPSLAKWLG